MFKLNILRTQLQKCLRNYNADADVSHNYNVHLRSYTTHRTKGENLILN